MAVWSPKPATSTLSWLAQKVDVSNATATLTLLNGADKQEVALVPQGEWLGAAGDFKVAKGTKAVAVVKQAGKTVTVRFVLP